MQASNNTINATEYLDDTVRAHAEKVAVVQGEQRTTFGELHAHARQIATAIIQRDEHFRRPVAVFLPRSGNCISTFLGVLFSGNFYVPLDVNSPIERLNGILDDLSPLLLLTSSEQAQTAESLSVSRENVLLIDDVAGTIDETAIESRTSAMIDTDPIYIKYTSGSTGDPKGVVLPHRAVIDYIAWAQETYQLDHTDTIASQAPFTFDVSVQDIYLSLMTGARLLLVPDEYFVFPAQLVSYLAEQRVTWFCWVPSVLVNVCNFDLLAGADTSSLKWVTVLGEVMPTKHFKYWARHCPNATLVNTYGPTETAVASTFYILDREFDDDQPLPIGYACRNTEILVLNDDNRPARPGEQGQICIRGSSLALGYWNSPEKTSQAFAPLPLHSHYRENIYRTGDLGFRNDRGELMFSGRRDSQIKHMGYRIELSEIETVAAALDEIDHACVLYDPDRKAILLFYESKRELDRGDLRKRLSARLPTYMLPKTLKRVESFPLNPNGKVDRRRLLNDYN